MFGFFFSFWFSIIFMRGYVYLKLIISFLVIMYMMVMFLFWRIIVCIVFIEILMDDIGGERLF